MLRQGNPRDADWGLATWRGRRVERDARFGLLFGVAVFELCDGDAECAQEVANTFGPFYGKWRSSVGLNRIGQASDRHKGEVATVSDVRQIPKARSERTRECLGFWFEIQGDKALIALCRRWWRAWKGRRSVGAGGQGQTCGDHGQLGMEQV